MISIWYRNRFDKAPSRQLIALSSKMTTNSHRMFCNDWLINCASCTTIGQALFVFQRAVNMHTNWHISSDNQLNENLPKHLTIVYSIFKLTFIYVQQNELSWVLFFYWILDFEYLTSICFRSDKCEDISDFF